MIWFFGKKRELRKEASELIREGGKLAEQFDVAKLGYALDKESLQDYSYKFNRIALRLMEVANELGVSGTSEYYFDMANNFSGFADVADNLNDSIPDLSPFNEQKSPLK